jgi:transcriptional regulator with XRE-family HTH domain
MIVGERLKAIREMKNMSQGDIEKKTGLLRCYISRVENGHTVPVIETLEKMARAMDVSMSQLFHEAEGSPEPLKLPKRATMKLSGKDGKVISRLSRLVSRMEDRDKKLLVGFAQKLAAR